MIIFYTCRVLGCVSTRVVMVVVATTIAVALMFRSVAVGGVRDKALTHRDTGFVVLAGVPPFG